MKRPKKTINEMTRDMIMAAALKCPLIKQKGVRQVNIESGDWFAYAAKTEITKRYRKACTKEVMNRKLLGSYYDGFLGSVKIGGKTFYHCPYSDMLVRSDFAQWAEANFDSFWDSELHRERLPEAPKGDTIKIRETLKIWKDIRRRALEMADPTGLLHEGSYNTLYDMKKTLAEYSLEIRRDEKAGRFYVSTKVLADHLAATIAYREKSYSDAMDFYLSCAASALKAALFIQKNHGEG